METNHNVFNDIKPIKASMSAWMFCHGCPRWMLRAETGKPSRCTATLMF